MDFGLIIKKISNMLPPGVLIGLMELLDFFFVKLSSEFSSETYNLISILRELAFIAANVSLLPFLNKLSKMTKVASFTGLSLCRQWSV